MGLLRISVPKCNYLFRRELNTSNVQFLIQKWRKERGLPLNPNSSGVLTDSPDYSYADGRLTPLNVGQRKRILEQRAIAEKIIQLTKEVDFAVAWHKQKQIDKENEQKNRIQSRLKRKGEALLSSK